MTVSFGLVVWTIYVFGAGVACCHRSNQRDNLPDALAVAAVWPLLITLGFLDTARLFLRGLYRVATRTSAR